MDNTTINVQSAHADHSANVDINKVGGGYFESQANAQSLIEQAIVKHCINLPVQLNIADFGGGTGYLLRQVNSHLEQQGHQVSPIVVDANPAYLQQAEAHGLLTQHADLTEVSLTDYNMILMRCVNHYNPLHIQHKILDNCFATLKHEGYLISQFLSGTAEDCQLMSTLMNHPLVGRAKSGDQYYITTEVEHRQMLKDHGFNHIVLTGYAPEVLWNVEESLWQRFNETAYQTALQQNDVQTVKAIEARHAKFTQEANALIQQTIDAHPDTSHFYLGANNTYYRKLQLSIVVCQKII